MMLLVLCLAGFLPRAVQAQTPPVADGSVTIRLEHIFIQDETDPEQVGPFNPEDDPYFVVIKFRSRFMTPGSTQIIVCGETNSSQDDPLCGKPYDFEDLDEGEEADIPLEMGGATFQNVHFSTLDSIAHGDYPELLGMAVIAVENDLSLDEVLAAAMSKVPDLRDKLIAKVEKGGALDDFLQPSNPTDDAPAEQVKGTGCGGEGLAPGDTPGNDLDTGPWGPLVGGMLGGVIGSIVAEDVFNAFVDFYADDPVDLRSIGYLTVQNEALARECGDVDINNAEKAFLTLLPQPGFNECESGATACQRFQIGSDPVRFIGSDGEWHVTLAVNTDAVASTLPPAGYVRSSTPLVHSAYLPLAVRDLNLPPTETEEVRTVPIRTLQYNVQFLTPWNEGTVDAEHWPNTHERAVAIGEALACYDLVTLNESVNDARRQAILATMQVKAPDCGRPNLLAGEPFFTSVSGPRLEDSAITGLSPALDTLRTTRTYTDFVMAKPAQPLVGDELSIISRFPIVESNTYIYHNATGIDALAAKGVLHARIQVGDPDQREFVDVFTTHLQAGDAAVRSAQLLELSDFIAGHAEPDIPVMLLGDFNIAGPYSGRSLTPEEQASYDFLLEAVSTLASGHKLQDIGVHLPKGTNQHKDVDKHRKDRIDYIFLSPGMLQVDPQAVSVKEFDGNGWGTLSDHAAVEANITWRKSVRIPLEGRPDLVVDGIAVTAAGVEVVIKNVGNAPLMPGNNFWVDMYIAPRLAPTTVNQVWEDMGENGLVWGVVSSAMPLPPGAQFQLMLHDPYYAAERSQAPALIQAGSRIYVQVDSANRSTGYGAVLEGHEEQGQSYNNIASLTLLEDVATSSWNTNTEASAEDRPAVQTVLLTTPR